MIVEELAYLDFDLSIQREQGGYRARADSPAGQAAVTFTLPFSDLELENFLLRVGRTRRGTRRMRPTRKRKFSSSRSENGRVKVTAAWPAGESARAR